MLKVKGVRNVVPCGTGETINRVVEKHSPMLLRIACTRLDCAADAEEFDGVQALFTLPLDASLADPAAADAFVKETGLNVWSNTRTAEPENTGLVSIQKTEGGSWIAAETVGEDGAFTIIPKADRTEDMGVQYQIIEDDGAAADITE